jgi:hypothetical protein
MTPTSITNNLTKFAIAACVALATGATAKAQITGNDTAANYGGGWTTGSNGGTGFGNWTITSNSGTGGAGVFTGNASAAGISGMADPSFGLYANPDGSGAYVTAARSFQNPLSVGQVFSFKWGNNWDSGGSGNKGFTISSNGSEIVNVNQSGFPGNITFSGNNTGIQYGPYPMTWTFNRTSSTNLHVSATGRNGNSTIVFSANVTISSAPTSFSWYASNLSNTENSTDSRQPYFNDLLITGNFTPDAPVISGASYAVAATGVQFSYQIASSPAATSYNASGLPGGLTLNSTTGLISGTPSATGTSNVSLTATNAGGTSAPFNLTIAVGVGADAAQNYGGNWTTGSNQGIGFGSWTITSNSGNAGFSGAFIGNPTTAEINGMSPESFGLFANPNTSNASVTASRSIQQGLSVNQTLSFQWAVNFDADGGEKGFRLYSGGLNGTAIVTVKQGSFPGNITCSGEETNLQYGTYPMVWSFSRTSATNLNVSATSRNGSSTVVFSQNLTISADPNWIEFYAQNMGPGDQRQPYFNNFLIQGASPPQPEAYTSWAGSYGLNATVTTGQTAGAPTADPDSDGFINQQEYAFGTIPNQPNPGLVSTTQTAGNFTVTFNTRSNFTYNAQTTGNLATTAFLNNSTVTNSIADSSSQAGVPSGYTRRQFTVAPSGGRNFYRVSATPN